MNNGTVTWLFYSVSFRITWPVTLCLCGRWIGLNVIRVTNIGIGIKGEKDLSRHWVGVRNWDHHQFRSWGYHL